MAYPAIAQVVEAYLAGLEARAAQAQPVKNVASVASFFVSRIDTLVDPLLESIIKQGGKQADTARMLRGQVAIASAKAAYQDYKQVFGSDRYRHLAGQGARTQRLLWASTSTKNPEYSDIMYVEALIGRDTIDTVTLETLDDYRDHGRPQERIEQGVNEALGLLDKLPGLGIDLEEVTQQLEDQGVEKFSRSFDELMETLSGRLPVS